MWARNSMYLKLMQIDAIDVRNSISVQGGTDLLPYITCWIAALVGVD